MLHLWRRQMAAAAFYRGLHHYLASLAAVISTLPVPAARILRSLPSAHRLANASVCKRHHNGSMQILQDVHRDKPICMWKFTIISTAPMATKQSFNMSIGERPKRSNM